MKIRVGDERVGNIGLGLGWNTWAWRGRPISEATWEQLMDLFVASRCQWVRLDVRQSDWEPRDSRLEGYHWDTWRMRALYHWLDTCEAHGIDVLWANYYTSDSALYPSDPASAWMSLRVQKHLAETGQYPAEWPQTDEAADHGHFVDSFADVLEYLVKQRGYSCIKQVSLFNEATSDHTFADYNPWPFYRGLDVALRERGIRDRIKILGPDDHNVPPWFWRELVDFPIDIIAFHDYWNLFDANKVANARIVDDYHSTIQLVGRGMGDYAQVAAGVKALAPKLGHPMQLAITEYGHTGNTWQLLPTSDPAEVFRGMLSMKCFLCEVLKMGYEGALRWSHWPDSWGHSYGPVAVQGVYYDPEGKGQGVNLADALRADAPLVTVPFVYEPERLASTVIRRGDYTLQAQSEDVPLGVHWVALANGEGEQKLFLVNLRDSSVDIEWEIAAPEGAHLHYEGAPDGTLMEDKLAAEGGKLRAILRPRSLNGLLAHAGLK